MISHLASLAEERLIISFAPKTLGYEILKRIGELFPGPSKVRAPAAAPARAAMHGCALSSARLCMRVGWGRRRAQHSAAQRSASEGAT